MRRGRRRPATSNCGGMEDVGGCVSDLPKSTNFDWAPYAPTFPESMRKDCSIT